MSADLADLKRLKVTRETRIWLASKSHSTGIPKHEIARDALHEIAARELHAARVMVAMADSEDRARASEDHSRAGRGQVGK